MEKTCFSADETTLYADNIFIALAASQMSAALGSSIALCYPNYHVNEKTSQGIYLIMFQPFHKLEDSCLRNVFVVFVRVYGR